MTTTNTNTTVNKIKNEIRKTVMVGILEGHEARFGDIDEKTLLLFAKATIMEQLVYGSCPEKLEQLTKELEVEVLTDEINFLKCNHDGDPQGLWELRLQECRERMFELA